MNYPRYILTILMIATISSCALYFTAQNIDSVDTTLNSNMSLIVGSVTQTSDGVPNPFDDKVAFYFRKKDGKDHFRLESADIYQSMWELPNKSLGDLGLKELNGKLFAVQIQPGTYQLMLFTVEFPSQQQIEFVEPIEFEIAAGEVVYLGNLDAHFCIRHAYANQYGIAGVIVSVNNEILRDEPLLKAKFNALAQKKLIANIINNQIIKQQGSELSKGCL